MSMVDYAEASKERDFSLKAEQKERKEASAEGRPFDPKRVTDEVNRLRQEHAASLPRHPHPAFDF